MAACVFLRRLLIFFQSLMHIKERKDIEDNFKKAQKPWAKLLAKVNKAKSDYHGACKTEKSASNQERNASGDSSLSMDQVMLNVCCTFFEKRAIISFPNDRKGFNVFLVTDSDYKVC